MACGFYGASTARPGQHGGGTQPSPRVSYGAAGRKNGSRLAASRRWGNGGPETGCKSRCRGCRRPWHQPTGVGDVSLKGCTEQFLYFDISPADAGFGKESSSIGVSLGIAKGNVGMHDGMAVLRGDIARTGHDFKGPVFGEGDVDLLGRIVNAEGGRHDRSAGRKRRHLNRVLAAKAFDAVDQVLPACQGSQKPAADCILCQLLHFSSFVSTGEDRCSHRPRACRFGLCARIG